MIMIMKMTMTIGGGCAGGDIDFHDCHAHNLRYQHCPVFSSASRMESRHPMTAEAGTT